MHHASRFFVFYAKLKINLTWPNQSDMNNFDSPQEHNVSENIL